MAYGDEIRRTETYVERDRSGYILPVVLVLALLGLGLWFVTSYQPAPTSPVSTTIERTTPAPAPSAPAPTTPVSPTAPK